MLLFLAIMIFVVIPTFYAFAVGILRWAVQLTNGFLGGRTPRDSDYVVGGANWGADLRSAEGILIPDPGVQWAVVIITITGAVNFLLQMGVVFLMYGFDQYVASAAGMSRATAQMTQMTTLMLTIPMGFVLRVGFMGGLLPTTAVKAVVVVLFEHVLWAALIALGVFALATFGVVLGVAGI